jgi:hypothetical protein
LHTFRRSGINFRATATGAVGRANADRCVRHASGVAEGRGVGGMLWQGGSELDAIGATGHGLVEPQSRTTGGEKTEPR